MIREGDSLPSVRQLADTVGVNMHTVNKAYTVLKQEGFIQLDRRHGAVIALDAEFRSAQKEADDLRASRNKLSKEIGKLMGQGKKEEAEAVKHR